MKTITRFIQILLALAFIGLMSGCSPSTTETDVNSAQKTNQNSESSENEKTPTNDAETPMDIRKEDLPENAILVQSKDDVDQLILAHIKQHKAGTPADPVHVVVPVQSEQQFQTIKEVRGNLCGIANIFEVRFVKNMTSVMKLDLGAQCEAPQTIIISANAPHSVKLAHISIDMRAESVEIRNLDWSNVHDPGAIINVFDATRFVMDNVSFDNLTLEPRKPYTGDPILVLENKDAEAASLDWSVKNSSFSRIENWQPIKAVSQSDGAKIQLENVSVDGVKLADGPSAPSDWEDIDTIKKHI